MRNLMIIGLALLTIFAVGATAMAWGPGSGSGWGGWMSTGHHRGGYGPANCPGRAAWSDGSSGYGPGYHMGYGPNSSRGGYYQGQTNGQQTYDASQLPAGPEADVED